MLKVSHHFYRVVSRIKGEGEFPVLIHSWVEPRNREHEV